MGKKIFLISSLIIAYFLLTLFLFNPVFAKLEDICKNVSNKTDCELCVKPVSEGGKGGAWTALGCIPTNSSGFVSWIFGPLIGIAGGIAFLLMLWGGFKVLTSEGDPQKVQGGKEVITSALAGLLLIIFSVFILRLIGVDILRIPGFQ